MALLRSGTSHSPAAQCLAVLVLLLAISAAAQDAAPRPLAEGVLTRPLSLSLAPGGGLLVLDERDDQRVAVTLDGAGAVLAEQALPPEAAQAEGLLSDAVGNLYLYNSRDSKITLIRGTAEPVSFDLGTAAALAVQIVGGQEWLYALGREAGSARRYRLPEMTVEPLALESWPAVGGFVRLRVTPDGSLYGFAAQDQLIYHYASTGKFVDFLGGGATLLAQPAMRLAEDFGVDAVTGDVYWSLGDYGALLRWPADGRQVVAYAGRQAWDRTWVGPVHTRPQTVVTGQTAYVLDPDRRRLVAFDLGLLSFGAPETAVTDTRQFGLVPAVAAGPPSGILFEPRLPLSVAFGPAQRRLAAATLDWNVYDDRGLVIGEGTRAVETPSGQELVFGLDPVDLPAYGWYEVVVTVRDGRDVLARRARHVGYTPRFAGMLDAEESIGGWNDVPRTAFCGLALHRIHIGDLNEVDKALALAERYGVTLLVQVENTEQAEPARLRTAVERFKERVRYWEIINEPNFTLSPEDYAVILERSAGIIREVDPDAKILGPTVCGLDLDWHRRFFATGAGRVIDILSVHSYEGNESIDADHWRWKVGELRQLVAGAGLPDMAIWQTERATGAVRGKAFIPGVQAARVLLERDLWETLGTSSEHNYHYYLNEGGYQDVPTYLWSNSGPHPAALALRTRAAMLLGQTYEGVLDAGPVAAKLFLALSYRGTQEQVISLRNLGATELPVTLTVRGTHSVALVDSYGNKRQLDVTNGQITVPTTTLPLYLRAPAAAALALAPVDWGANLAAGATVTYSGKTDSDAATLTNSRIENVHPSTPWGSLWAGELKQPETLELALPTPQTVDRVVIYSAHADNPYCALLDFDLQVPDGDGWRTVAEVRSATPPSVIGDSSDALVTSWYNDENLHVVATPAQQVSRLRLRALRVTQGFMPDRVATDTIGWVPGGETLHLREIELYGPAR